MKAHRLGAPTTAKQPKTHKLEDVASWNIEQLPQDQRQKLFAAIEAAKADGRVLRIGTACSGTDSPVPVFLRLAEALKGLEVEHTFSCEFCEKKQDWIHQNFPDLPCFFKDVKELGTGHVVNVITGEFVAVPKTDILVAGFVCKSVSTENNKHDTFAECIDKGIGSTGETFSGVHGYIERFKPSIVICENVEGLVKQFTNNDTCAWTPNKVFMRLGTLGTIVDGRFARSAHRQ